MHLLARLAAGTLCCVPLALAPEPRRESGTTGRAAAEFPSRTLDNGALRLLVYLPDHRAGYYRGTRFDWSGIVARADYRGHTFFGPWKGRHDPSNHDDIAGPVEEFGTEAPLGYAEANPGDTFIKIGVGHLERGNEPEYQFARRYRLVEPGSWSVRSDRGELQFTQELKDERGWGYQYVKSLRIDREKPEFVIDHRFRNTGPRAIATDQYNHNFLSIDGDRIGPDYSIRLGFKPSDAVLLPGVADLRGGEILFRRVIPDGQSVFRELDGLTGKVSDYRITVENRRTGAGVRIEGDTPPSRFRFWAVNTTACPEPFVPVRVQPGQETRWSIRYTFTASRAPG